jgi:F-type H+-transporting ATPase subunit a
MTNTANLLRRFRMLWISLLLVCGPLALRAFASEGGEGESGIPELPNAIELLHKYFKGKPQEKLFNELFAYQNVIFFMIIALLLIALAFFGTRKLKRIPTGFQAFLEFVVTSLDGFICSVIGPAGKPYVPLCGTIFIFILCMNLSGLIPFYKSPIALNINVPLSLALCVFVFVHYHGIRQNGIVGYIKHYIEPLPWYMAPITILLVVIHLIGELAKPLTLTLRLFGNITGEDVVIAALVILGLGLPFLPLPLQILFFPLGLLFSFIQALVFTILTSVYILLLMGHGPAHEEGH